MNMPLIQIYSKSFISLLSDRLLSLVSLGSLASSVAKWVRFAPFPFRGLALGCAWSGIVYGGLGGNTKFRSSTGAPCKSCRKVVACGLRHMGDSSPV